MDPLSALRALLPSLPGASLEGRVESVDAKQGTVAVRLPTGELLVAQGEGIAAGERVQLGRGTDGAWTARIPSKADLPNLVDAAVPDWFGTERGADLVRAARSGDAAQVRSVLAALWIEIAGATSEDLPASLQAAKTRGMGPLATLAAAARSVGAGASPLALRSESAPGSYQAETAGRRFDVVGPAGLPLGDLGLWTESVVGEILSLWLPTALESTGAPDLPGRVTPDAAGARRILDRLGVPVAPDGADDKALASLVRTLVRAGALLEPGSAMETVPDPFLASTSAPGVVPGPPTVASPPSDGIRPTAASNAVAGPASGFLERLVAAAVEGEPIDPVLVDAPPPGSPPETEGLPTLPAAQRSPEQIATLLAKVLESIPTEAIAGTRTPEARRTAPTAALTTPAKVDGLPEQDPATGADSAGQAAAKPRDLPAALALRVALAWALSDGEPSTAVLKAAIGDVADVPDTLHRLATALGQRPRDFEAVSAFLAKADPDSPLLPRHLGLDAPHGKHAAAVATTDARTLAQAIVDDLGKALQQGREPDAATLREALGSLVAEGLDGARDPANPMAAAPWTLVPRGERPDSGRVVVRDRRKPTRDKPEKTVVEVSMNPTGLGSVDARLELRGHDLDVSFHAREAGAATLIRDSVPELRRILTTLGLEPRNLDVKVGRKPAATSGPESREAPGGLDIRA